MTISIRNARFALIGLQNLCNYIGDCHNKTIAEIGCYVGDSTEIFAERFKKVYAIDPFKNGYDSNDGASFQHPMTVIERQFDSLCLKYPNIHKMKMPSNIAVITFEDHYFDMVYIDGLHTYEGVKIDIALWKSKVKPGGYLAGHDYNSKHFPGVKKAVHELKVPDATFKDSSWIIKL